MKEHKFICDRNLGKLAKYLRLAGYYCLWDNNLSKTKIVNLAKKKRLIILTRNKTFFNRNDKSKKIKIKSDNVLMQLTELKGFIFFDEKKLFSRCSKCNSVLKKNTEESETFCLKCRKKYWFGSHARELKEKFKLRLR
ncbi:MAG: hypothetical protein CSB55_07035 [Candidatus Cloacimonadota bacterium]|nr:MAG: hypothetical protein CSB55_07035 [Candidatus Cloacimonadota bacterium]